MQAADMTITFHNTTQCFHIP